VNDYVRMELAKYDIARRKMYREESVQTMPRSPRYDVRLLEVMPQEFADAAFRLFPYEHMIRDLFDRCIIFSRNTKIQLDMDAMLRALITFRREVYHGDIQASLLGYFYTALASEHEMAAYTREERDDEIEWRVESMRGDTPDTHTSRYKSDPNALEYRTNDADFVNMRDMTIEDVRVVPPELRADGMIEEHRKDFDDTFYAMFPDVPRLVAKKDDAVRKKARRRGVDVGDRIKVRRDGVYVDADCLELRREGVVARHYIGGEAFESLFEWQFVRRV
jgi:hypothetical protein